MSPRATPSYDWATTLLGLTFGKSHAADMAVSIKPTMTPVTPVPCAESSRRIALVADHAAALDAAYAELIGVHTESDSTLRIPPPPFAARTGANALVTRSVPK